MEMIDVLKNQLQDGMTISKVKILQNKTKFTLKYDGIEKQGEIQNTCAIGYEQRLCRKSIDTLMSGIYIDKNQLDLARKWLNGEMWENFNNKAEETKVNEEDYKIGYSKAKEDIESIIKQKINDIENKSIKANRHMNDLEYGAYETLKDILYSIDSL